MEISVNGKIHTLHNNLTLAELIAQLNISGQRFAVEINQTVIPRSSYKDQRLVTGDRVEIIHAIGGG